MCSIISSTAYRFLKKSAKNMDPIIGAVAGGVMDIAMNDWKQQQQINQAEKLQTLQIEGQKELTDYNQKKQLEMWDKTNYAAQRKQLEKAGLNVAMMYGQGGGGGTTTDIKPGSIQGQAAQLPQGRGMEIGIQAAATMAQTDLMKAEAKKAEAEAEKISGVDTAVGLANEKLISSNTLKQDLENDYYKNGAYNDGLNGYQIRYNKEVQETYALEMAAAMNKAKIKAIPKELALEGQRIAIEAQRAANEAERNKIYERIENLRRNAELIMHNDRIRMQGDALLQQNKQYNRSQDETEFQNKMNNTFRVFEDAFSASIPWFKPPQTTTTTTERHSNGEGGYYEHRRERRE